MDTSALSNMKDITMAVEQHSATPNHDDTSLFVVAMTTTCQETSPCVPNFPKVCTCMDGHYENGDTCTACTCSHDGNNLPCQGLETTWKSIYGLLTSISVGSKGVWGVNPYDSIFYRLGTLEHGASSGSGWAHVEFRLKQISSGHSVWGVNANDDIFIRQGITSSNPTGTGWLNIEGKLKQLDVSSTADQVWGVNMHNYIYRRTGITTEEPAGTGWEHIEGSLKFVSIGPAGVWGVDENNDIFYRTGTYGNEASAGSDWEHIEGKLKQISSGDNIVWGVNVNDNIFIREGISSSTPTGSNWQRIPGKLDQVEASPRGQQAWGVDSGVWGGIFHLITGSVSDCPIAGYVHDG
ncbi:lectin L6-like [Branchiostoma lanceolatum]|uniref:lectin L6-like n=1 Tax=Branchiostoma lanceolatum TaxID=7740 RepID=UPI003456E7E1